MFPAYVTLYKDKDNKIHLYFFPGITDEDNFYYKKLDMSECGKPFIVKKYEDKSREFIFDDTSIKGVKCKLIKNHNKKINYETVLVNN